MSLWPRVARHKQGSWVVGGTTASIHSVSVQCGEPGKNCSNMALRHIELKVRGSYVHGRCVRFRAALRTNSTPSPMSRRISIQIMRKIFLLSVGLNIFVPLAAARIMPRLVSRIGTPTLAILTGQMEVNFFAHTKIKLIPILMV